MAELTINDVRNYSERLSDDDDAVLEALLAAALGLARRYCGWHVTPERTDEDLKIDGQGGRLLALPTLRLATDGLTDLAENGIALDVGTDLEISARGLVRKVNGRWWTCRFGGIVVTMKHGFVDAPEWQSAVLSYIDRSAMVVAGGGRETIGPFTFVQTAVAVSSAFSDTEKAILDLYRLEMAP